jgi:hypothetical protein
MKIAGVGEAAMEWTVTVGGADEKPALDGLPALLFPLFHGLHGSRRNSPGPGRP